MLCQLYCNALGYFRYFMNSFSYTRFPSFAAASVLIPILLFCADVDAQTVGQKRIPLRAENFVQSAPRGFGDRQNSWAQAMVWWRGNLYVGTARASLCSSLAAVNQWVALTINKDLADTYLPYPPP